MRPASRRCSGAPGSPELFYASGAGEEGLLYSILARRDDGAFRYLRVGTEDSLPSGIPQDREEGALDHHAFVLRGVVESVGTVEVMTEGTSVGETDVMLHRIRGDVVEAFVLLDYSSGG